MSFKPDTIESNSPNIGLVQFFTELTLNICGSLDIEKALWKSLLYIRNIMPADELLLTSYDAELGALEIVAGAGVEGGATYSDKVYLHHKLRETIEKPELIPRVRITDSLQDGFVSLLADRLGWERSSIMACRLVLEGEYIGALTVRAVGKARYTESHKKLWEMLNEPAAIALANIKRYRELENLKDRFAEDKRYLPNEIEPNTDLRMIGSGLRGVVDQVRKVAGLPSAVLVYGETGTGKELVANMIHSLSPRSSGPFVKINCGAIPDSLMDSELFGHEKGAFTGAVAQKRGQFERAHGGTIFLDEVSELTPQAQVRLLRVIQEKEIERVGGSGPIKIDVRIISATNRDLERLTETRGFRKDLYFRLKVFPITVPPLRARKNDIPELVKHFISKKSQEMSLPEAPGLAPGSMDVLMSYDWPGNVRELENAVERALILSGGLPLDFANIIGNPAPERPAEVETEKGVYLLRDVERTIFSRALETSRGKIEGPGGAAELLGVHPWTLRRKLKKLDMHFGRKKKTAL